MPAFLRNIIELNVTEEFQFQHHPKHLFDILKSNSKTRQSFVYSRVTFGKHFLGESICWVVFFELNALEIPVS